MRIIGLSGYTQVGKDTVANILVEEHGYTRVAFADPMRECLYALNPIIRQFEDRDGEHTLRIRDMVDSQGWEWAKVNPPYGDEVRALMQRLGTEVGREIISTNVWIDIAMKRAWDILRTDGGRVVFTDVRFPNEYAAIADSGYGLNVRVFRPGTAAVNGHSSESALDGHTFDRHIHNDGSIEQLRERVSTLA